MTGKRERAQPAGGDEVVGRVTEGATQHTLGLRVVARVARFACALLVREAEQAQTDDTCRIRAHLLLQLRDQSATARDDARGNRDSWRLLRRAVGQHPAQQEGRGGRARRQPSEDEPLRSHQGCCRPFVLSYPLNGSAWYGK